MSEQKFMDSIGVIRGESMDMLKNLRAVRGENYARFVHSIILGDQIVNITEAFSRGVKREYAATAELMVKQQESMMGLVMEYYMRSTSLSEKEIDDAFKDATILRSTMNGLVEKAAFMANNGQSMGDVDA